MTSAIERPITAPIVAAELPQPVEGHLRRLAELVARIYNTYAQIAQNDRKEISNIEYKYTFSCRESSDSMRSRGRFAVATAFAGIVLHATSLAFRNVNDQKFVQLISDKIPNFVQLLDSRRDASQKDSDSISSLKLTQLQEKSGKAQSESGAKEQFAKILSDELQRHRQAASAN